MFNQFYLNKDYYFEINGNEFDFFSTMHILLMFRMGLEKSWNFFTEVHEYFWELLESK